MWGAALALALPGALTGQQVTDTVQASYVVGEALPPVEEGVELVAMTLDDAIARALESNLDIQTVRLDPQIQRYSLLAAQAAFSPTFSTTVGYNNQKNQSTSQLDAGTGISQVTNQVQTFNASLTKPMSWLGARLSANFNNRRSETNSAFTTRNPSYSSTFSLNYSQPLLSGLRIDNQRAALQTQEIQGQITDIRVRSQVANITNQVRQSYWALRAAIEQVEIQRRNLEQARRLLEQDRLQVRLGRMTEIQMLQAEAQVAGAEQALLDAQIQWHNQELAFKSLLVSGARDPLLGQAINPTSRPTDAEVAVDIDAAVQLALRERADLRQEQRQVDISRVSLDVTKSNTLPDLTLSAGYSLQGVGGNLYSRDGIGGAAQLVREGDYWDGLQAIRDRETPTWNVSITGSVPVGTNPNKANLERARLQLQQSELALKSYELTIITEVTRAGYAVRNAYLQLQAARRSREAAERSFQGELQRLEVGAATNYEVVQSQNQMTTARLSELRAVIDYANAIAEFERVQRYGG